MEPLWLLGRTSYLYTFINGLVVSSPNLSIGNGTLSRSTKWLVEYHEEWEVPGVVGLWRRRWWRFLFHGDMFEGLGSGSHTETKRLLFSGRSWRFLRPFNLQIRKVQDITPRRWRLKVFFTLMSSKLDSSTQVLGLMDFITIYKWYDELW